MTQQILPGDTLTIIKYNGLMTTVNEATVHTIENSRIIITQNGEKSYLNPDNTTLVLKGHNLGITQATWKNGTRTLMTSNHCSLGGLDRDSMITLLKTNINQTFNQWENIYWFDGTSSNADSIFVPRPISDNYLRYREQAEANKPKTAAQYQIGDYLYTYVKGSKYQHLTDMLQTCLEDDQDNKTHLSLGKIVEIVDITDQQFDALQYLENTNLLKNTGGNVSDDIAEGRDEYTLSSFELQTIYTHYTLIRTPSGRAITVDPQNYGYMRYTGLLCHYRQTMKADCEKIYQLRQIAKEQAEQEKKETEQLARQQFDRINKEYPNLIPVVDYHDHTTAGANLRKMLKAKFPATKFSVAKQHLICYHVNWTDGPTVEQVSEITYLFSGRYFDNKTEIDQQTRTQFAKHYGTFEYLFTNRTISTANQTATLAAINKELGTAYTINDYVNERLEYMDKLVHKRASQQDYSPAPSPAEAEKTSLQTIESAGIQIVDYSPKSFAVIGDTKPIKDILSDLGGSFNTRLKCGPGWIFPKTKLETLKQTLSIN